MQENMKQMQEANAKQMKEMQEHHETVMKERMAEQARLLQEGFEKEADHLKELIRSAHVIFKGPNTQCTSLSVHSSISSSLTGPKIRLDNSSNMSVAQSYIEMWY